MLNMSDNVTAEGDCLGNFETYQKTLAAIFWSCTVLPGVPLMYSIIWYERYGWNNDRSIFSQLESSCVWCAVIYVLINPATTLLRVWIGPLPYDVCVIQVFLNNVLGAYIALTFFCIIILKFLYVFYWRNVGALRDDFAFVLISVNCFAVSMVMSAFRLFLDMNFDPGFLICIGHPIIKGQKRFPLLFCLGNVVGVLFVIYKLARWWGKRRTTQNGVAPAHQPGQFLQGGTLTDMMTHLNLYDVGAVLVAAIPFTFFVVLKNDWMSAYDSSESRWNWCISEIGTGFFVGIFMPIWMYSRDKDMKRIMIREVKNFVGALLETSGCTRNNMVAVLE